MATDPTQATAPNREAEAKTKMETQTEPRRKKRWGRRLLILFLVFIVLVVGLVGAAPWIASQPQARATILGYVNDAIPGEVRLDAISLGWFSPLEIDGLTILDDQQREVVKAKRLHVATGLAKIAQAPTRFTEVIADSPDIVLYMNEDGTPSVVSAFVKQKEREDEDGDRDVDSGDMPEIVGRVLVKNGNVRVIPAKGKEQSVREINVDVALQTLNDIEGKLGFVMDGGGLSAQADIENLTSDGRVDPSKASGKLSVKTDGELDLGPLMAMLMPDQPATGKATVDINATFAPEKSSGTLKANVKQLKVASAGGEALDVDCNGNFDLKGTTVDALLNVTGTPGNAKVTLNADTAQEVPELKGEDILAAILGEKSIELPEFSLSASSKIDLAKVERALPGVLKFESGYALSGGVVDVEEIAMTGGKSPKLDANATISNAALSKGGEVISIEPMRLGVKTNLEPSSGLNVESMNLTSGFATVTASGNSRDLEVSADGDMAKIRNEIGRFFDMGDVDMSGRLQATAKLKKSTDNEYSVTATVNANQARIQSGESSLVLSQSTISQDGTLTMKGDQPSAYKLTQFSADLDKQIVISGKGNYDLDGGGFEADLKVDRGDLAFAAQRAEVLGVPELKRFAGNIAGSIRVKGAADSAIDTSGDLSATGLTADGKSVVQDQLAIRWDGVSYAEGGKKLRAAVASITSREITAEVKDANIDLASGESASGELKVNADFVPLFTTVGRLAQMEATPGVKGKLSLEGNISKSGDAIQIAANGGIDQLEIGEGAGAVRENRVAVELDGKLDTKKSTLVLGTNKLSSGLLDAQIAGRIDDYSGEMRADLTGEYSTEWAAISKLIEELSPSTAKYVSIKGTSRSGLALKGPLNKKSAEPPFKDATASAGVGWDSANVMGIDLSQAKIDMAMKNGSLDVKSNRIAAAQGAINVASSYELATSTLRMPGKTAVLDGVILTPELARELLSRINPVFYHVVSAEGNVDLRVNDLVLPMGENPTGGSGGGKLELKKAKIEPGGVFGELVKMGVAMQSGEKVAVTLEGADFEVRDGRVHYDNFTMIFPYEFDLVFRGSVGLNDTLDLIVSIPIKPELLQRLGIKGPTVEYAKALAGTRIDVPLVGTRENPKLDLSKVATDALLKKAVEATAGKAAEDVLKGAIPGLGGGKKDDAKKDGKGQDKGKDGKKEKKKGIGGLIPGVGG